MNIETQFLNACKTGNLNKAKQIYLNNLIDEECAFLLACVKGQLHIAKWLLQIKPNINISVHNEEAFRCACESGHLHVAQWLLQIKPTINVFINDHSAFKHACIRNKWLVVKWLCELYPFKYDIEFNNRMWSRGYIDYNSDITGLLFMFNYKGYLNKLNSSFLMNDSINYVI